jgi:hypothetical protein
MMKTIALCTAAILATLAASPAVANRPAPGTPVASVHISTVGNWRAFTDRALYIDAGHHQWYEANLASPCWGLPDVQRVKLAMPVPNTFDTSSSVLVGHEQCPVTALFKVDRPPVPIMDEGDR